MILKDYLRKVYKEYGWFEISDAMLEIYPDQEGNIDGYAEALTELLNTDPLEKEPHMTIYVEMVTEPYQQEDGTIEEETYGHVFGRNGNTRRDVYSEDGIPIDNFNDEFLDQEESYAIELTPWDECLGMSVESSLGPLETVAHILWELTFFGYSNESVQKKANDLLSQYDEAREAFESGDTERFAPIDDILGENDDNSA